MTDCDETLVVEMTGGDGGVAVVAERAVVQARHVRGDHFAVAGRQRAGRMEQRIREIAERLRRLRTKRQQGANSRESVRQLNVWHKAGKRYSLRSGESLVRLHYCVAGLARP